MVRVEQDPEDGTGSLVQAHLAPSLSVAPTYPTAGACRPDFCRMRALQAKQRNPGLKTYGLSWGVPGWVGRNNASDTKGNFFTQRNLEYHVRWVQGLKKWHNISLDYMGIWNERSPQYDWIVRLRSASSSSSSLRFAPHPLQHSILMSWFLTC